MRFAVTGAAGRLGGQVAQLLASDSAHQVLGVCRRPVALPPGVSTTVADYADPGALRSSLTGVDTLVLISSDGEGTRVLTHHQNIVAAARDCGVRHIVLLSGVDADVSSPFCYAITNGFTEQLVRASGCDFSIARASLFTEFFGHFLLPSRTSGRLELPMADGRVGLVSRTDVGRCLAALATSAPTGRHHALTGPAALGGAALADVAAQVWGRSVTYRPIAAAEQAAELAATEEPWWAYAYGSMFASIREQRWAEVTTEVQQLTGQSPRPVPEVLSEAAATV